MRFSYHMILRVHFIHRERELTPFQCECRGGGHAYTHTHTYVHTYTPSFPSTHPRRPSEARHVTWAHPAFGSILAVSAENTVFVYKEAKGSWNIEYQYNGHRGRGVPLPRFPLLHLLVLALLNNSVISFFILPITTASISVFCHSHPQQLCLG